MPKINDREIKALPPAVDVYERGFGDGFYLRIYPDGRKVARYRFRLAGKTRILTLGEYGRGAGGLTLADLLRAHTSAKGKVADGRDPALERDQSRHDVIQQRAEHDARINLKTVCEKFKREYAGRKGTAAVSTLREYHRRIDKTIIPEWGPHPAETLPTDSMMAHMQTMPPVEANRLFTTMGVILNWARKNGYGTVSNPFAGRDKPGGAEKSKTRALDYDAEIESVVDRGEIRSFWTATNALDANLRDALRLVLLTGQRPGEVLSMRMFHIKDDQWRIPAALTKSKKGVHVVPITSAMREIIQPRLEGDYLFPDQDGDKPLKHARLSRAIKSMQADDESPIHGLAAFTPHDLRRTCATQIGAMGYLDAEIGVLLNHTTPGVTSTYNRANAVKRIQPMLEAWHRRLKTILKGESDKVVRLRS